MSSAMKQKSQIVGRWRITINDPVGSGLRGRRYSRLTLGFAKTDLAIFSVAMFRPRSTGET